MEYHAFADEKGRKEVFMVLVDDIDQVSDSVMKKTWGLQCPVLIADNEDIWKQTDLDEIRKLN